MFEGKLNQFCADVNKVVVSKGFWSGMRDSIATLENENAPAEIIKDVGDAFVSQKVALIMSECAEALEAMRKDDYGLEKKDSFEDEIADVFIRLADLCGELNIDIETQIAWKLEHNKARGNKHGKNF